MALKSIRISKFWHIPMYIRAKCILPRPWNTLIHVTFILDYIRLGETRWQPSAKSVEMKSQQKIVLSPSSVHLQKVFCCMPWRWSRCNGECQYRTPILVMMVGVICPAYLTRWDSLLIRQWGFHSTTSSRAPMSGAGWAILMETAGKNGWIRWPMGDMCGIYLWLVMNMAV